MPEAEALASYTQRANLHESGERPVGNTLDSLGLSAAKLAFLTGYSVDIINKWSLGELEPKAAELVEQKIIKILDRANRGLAGG